MGFDSFFLIHLLIARTRKVYRTYTEKQAYYDFLIARTRKTIALARKNNSTYTEVLTNKLQQVTGFKAVFPGVSKCLNNIYTYLNTNPQKIILEFKWN